MSRECARNKSHYFSFPRVKFFIKFCFLLPLLTHSIQDFLSFFFHHHTRYIFFIQMLSCLMLVVEVSFCKKIQFSLCLAFGVEDFFFAIYYSYNRGVFFFYIQLNLSVNVNPLVGKKKVWNYIKKILHNISFFKDLFTFFFDYKWWWFFGYKKKERKGNGYWSFLRYKIEGISSNILKITWSKFIHALLNIRKSTKRSNILNSKWKIFQSWKFSENFINRRYFTFHITLYYCIKKKKTSKRMVNDEP